MADKDFELDVENVGRYVAAFAFVTIFLAGLFAFGAGIVLAPLYHLCFGRRFHARQARELRYRLEGGTLRIDEGVWFLKRKAIPLDRITDLALCQGPLMRRYGIWGLEVHTSGKGDPRPEATMLGLKDPVGVRDAVLARRGVRGD